MHIRWLGGRMNFLKAHNMPLPYYFHLQRYDIASCLRLLSSPYKIPFWRIYEGRRRHKEREREREREEGECAFLTRHAPNNIFKRQQFSTGQALLRYLPQHIRQLFLWPQRVSYLQFTRCAITPLAQCTILVVQRSVVRPVPRILYPALFTLK